MLYYKYILFRSLHVFYLFWQPYFCPICKSFPVIIRSTISSENYIYIYIFFGPTSSRWNKANVWRCWKATDLTTFLNVFFLYIIFFVGLTTIEGKAQICRESSIMLPSANLKPLTLYIAVTKVYQISNWNSKQSLWCFFFLCEYVCFHV